MAQVRKIDKLPPAIRDELNARLVAAGFGDSVALSEWLAEKGYSIGKSAIGEHSLALRRMMEKSMERARVRVECAKALNGLSDGDKAALLEANEMIALDQLMDIWDEVEDMEPEQRAELLPKLIRASAELGRSAVGTAKWRKDFEAKIKAEAAESVEKIAKHGGMSRETVDAIKAEILGIRRE